MNYYDAHQIIRLHHSGAPVGEDKYREASEFLRTEVPGRKPKQVSPRAFIQTTPTWKTLCTCGVRYGMHRHGDLTCFNTKWRPGNGEPQWLTRKWERA